MGSKRSVWLKIFIFLAFVIVVNLLAGFIATTLRYPSLYNVNASFAEYAMPLPYYWGMLHLPSMFIFAAPLVFLSQHQAQYIRYFRIFCLCVFASLLLLLDKKIPFLLFPNIDAFVALVLSFFAFPPSKQNNPKLVFALKWFVIGVMLIAVYFVYSFWQHQTPKITKRGYGGGLFELQSIMVKNDFHKEMLFSVDLKEAVPEDQLCMLAQPMAKAMKQDYPFDERYNKLIRVRFNPTTGQRDSKVYEMGEISLNKEHLEADGSYACYMKYK